MSDLDSTLTAHLEDVVRRVRARATSGRARRPETFRDLLAAGLEITAALTAGLMRAAWDRRGAPRERAEQARQLLLDTAAEAAELATRITAAGDTLSFSDDLSDGEWTALGYTEGQVRTARRNSLTPLELWGSPEEARREAARS